MQRIVSLTDVMTQIDSTATPGSIAGHLLGEITKEQLISVLQGFPDAPAVGEPTNPFAGLPQVQDEEDDE